MKIKINGQEQSGGLSGWSFSEKIGNPTSSTIQIVVGAGESHPNAGDVITITDDNDNAIFFGLVGIPKSTVTRSFFQPRVYTLNCTNGNSVLSRRIVNYSFVNKNITEIVNLLYSEYIASEGITLGKVSDIPSPVFEIYNCKNMTLLEVLNELAGYINGAWQVTNEKVFNFVAIEDFPRCSHVIDENSAIIGNLQTIESDRELRTSQVIDGAYITTDTQTENFTVSEEWTGFMVAFPIQEKPRIFLNSTEIPPEEIGRDGIDDGDTTKLFMWKLDSKEINLNSAYTGSIQIQQGDTITCEYVGLAPIRYEMRDENKIQELQERTGLSGIIDSVYTDNTITTKQDAETKALALLDMFGSQQRTIRCDVSRDFAFKKGFVAGDFELYTQWTFNLPQLELVGDFVLTEKTITQEVMADDESLMYRLTFTDRNFIQSYGEIISNLYHDMVKLSVRADELVISLKNLSETTTPREDLEVTSALGLWVCESMENGQIAQCLGSIVPNLVHGGRRY